MPALLLALLALGASASCAQAAEAPVTMTDYTDPAEAMPWPARSHWKQPWRSYLETVPATTLRDAIGINFNVQTWKPAVVRWTARLLAEDGFTRARIEVPWSSLSYNDPSHLSPDVQSNLESVLTAFRENHLRPLVLLNANSGAPCPAEVETIELTESAPTGATQIHIAPADVPRVVAGRTGIRSGGTAANYLFKSVQPDGTVELSAPLGELWQSNKSAGVVKSLEAGPLEVETLLYEPFRQAVLPDGTANPAFEPTMRGWLEYTGVVSREVKRIIGSEEFDVEVWNELSFGSRFLNIGAYYEPQIQPWKNSWAEEAILDRTVAYLRDPAHGVSGIGIGNGFANQAPSWNGTDSPPGLTAIDKHPYHGWDSYPTDAQVNGVRPLDGLGRPSGWQDAGQQWHESFTPHYESFFPEYFLSGLQTETLTHDLSPFPSYEGATLHGRFTHPEGSPPPEYWITEVNIDPTSGPTPRTEMSAADARHVETKSILRYLAAYVNKGVTAIDFYAAQGGNLALIDPSFFAAIKSSPDTYPGAAAGGETMTAVRRLVEATDGAEPISEPRNLQLRALTDFEGNKQFEGDGSEAYPPLFNRDVFGFFPFQVTAHRFVIPVYVMTRDVVENYDPGSTSPSRFDMPPEPYRLAISGVDGANAEVSATDPMTGSSVPVEVISGSADEIVVQMPVTDSPRLLTVQEDPAAEPPTVPVGGEPPSEGQTPQEPVGGAPAPADPPGTTNPALPGAGEGPAAPSQAGTGTPSRGGVASTRLQLQLRGGAALLHKRRLTAVAVCPTSCRPRFEGVLSVGKRRFPLRTRGSSKQAGRRTIASLSAGPGVVRAARRALTTGAVVDVSVVASLPQAEEQTLARRSLHLRRH